MKVLVRVHPNSSSEKIHKKEDCSFEVWLKEKAVDNKANISLMKILKRHFGKPIKIKTGLASRNKIIEVGDQN